MLETIYKRTIKKVPNDVTSEVKLYVENRIFLVFSVLHLFPISCEPTYTPGAGWRNRGPS